MNHPAVNRDLTCLVRHLQPTEKGIPVELYFFSAEKNWVAYEGIQADVFDHVLAVIPEFGLRVFQEVSGNDLRCLHGAAPRPPYAGVRPGTSAG
jgi:miniconductance mechanosensitive channel